MSMKTKLSAALICFGVAMALFCLLIVLNCGYTPLDANNDIRKGVKDIADSTKVENTNTKY